MRAAHGEGGGGWRPGEVRGSEHALGLVGMAGNDFEVTKAVEAEVRREEETRAVGEEDVWYGNATDVVLQDEVGVEGVVVADR